MAVADSPPEVEGTHPVDRMADAIREGGESAQLVVDQLERITGACEDLLNSGLTERALVLLLNDLTGVGRRDIRLVLDALPRLREFLED